MAVDARTRRRAARRKPPARTRRRPPPRTRRTLGELIAEWPAEAWGAIGVTGLFLLLTLWWVLEDHSVPISDAGFHLSVTIQVFKDLQAGEWGAAVAPHLQYPPLVYMVGAMGAFIGGLSIPSIVLALNLFFVPLLALGCYQIGRLAFSPSAGLLAVVFALGSPLIAKLFHLVLLDAPQAAMVSVSVWLILATGYFTRLRYCAAAGVAVGLGMLTKESFAIFVVGVLGVTLLRGGWRGWRGLLVFAAAVLVVAGPWYINDLTQVRGIATAVGVGAGSNSAIAPARFASENLQWYMWSLLDLQVLLPLFLFATVGGVWMIVGFIRRRMVSPLAPELAVGAFTSWLGLTETFVHDHRYGMSLLVWMAVFGTFWIVRLPRAGRIAAIAALVIIAVANTLGSTFGVGGKVPITLPHAIQSAAANPNSALLYSNEGYLVSAAPHTGDDMLATLRSLKQNGVEGVLVAPSAAPNQEAFLEGLLPLATLAEVQMGQGTPSAGLPRSIAVFDRELLSKGDGGTPCVKLPDRTGVWIRLGDPNASGAQNYCP